jgi:hypothetical protein
LLDVSDEVRAEIGDDEADRLLGGAHAPDTYDCTSCRTPGDSLTEPTSTVLFVGEETAVLAFAHARCIPSQVVPVSEAQLIGAVRSISQTQGGTPPPPGMPSDPLTAPLTSPILPTNQASPMTDPLNLPPIDPFAVHLAEPRPDSLSSLGGMHDPSFADPLSAQLGGPLSAQLGGPLSAQLGDPLATPLIDPLTAPLAAVPRPATAPTAPAGSPYPTGAPAPDSGARVPAPGEPAVLGVTCGLVLCGDTGHAAIVVEPTGPVGRPGSTSGTDEFLPLLLDNGFNLVGEVNEPPARLSGWSVLFAMGRLHSILQPSSAGTSAWWQAHAPLVVTEAWRSAASSQSTVIMYAAPTGTIGRQPREDLLRTALDRAAARGLLVAATLPLAGT